MRAKKQKSKRKINDKADLKVILEFVPTEDAEERILRVYEILLGLEDKETETVLDKTIKRL
jgi:hypothetical protein